MGIKRSSLTLAAFVSMGLALAHGAQAQVITQTFTVPTQSTPFSQNFIYNTFNTTLGTLEGVTLSLSTSVTAEVDIFNFTGINQNFTGATASIPVTLTAPGPTTLTATATAGPFSGTVLGTSIETEFTGLTTGANSSFNIPTSEFGLYENPPSTAMGILNVAAGAGSYAGTASSGVAFGGSATASGTITLTYLFQPAGTIPEPGPTTFLAAGVLGSIGMVFRRRKKA